jgi:hypothetical protein
MTPARLARGRRAFEVLSAYVELRGLDGLSLREVNEVLVWVHRRRQELGRGRVANGKIHRRPKAPEFTAYTPPPPGDPLFRCKRCRVAESTEACPCRLCLGDLCPRCWETYGQCPHESAGRAGTPEG